PFPLLVDPGNKIAKAYGADNGIPILGLDRRVTYVIGEDGNILKVYPNVDPSVHAKQIISELGADKPPPTPEATPTPTATATPQPTQHKQRKGIDSDSDSEPD
ncbi:MAG: redoxin domain-containing protein, partial [Deltaproteobacteria bacterium]|nr:redoxin domain-containing protein [Deltaproteobacteria bacterium]